MRSFSPDSTLPAALAVLIAFAPSDPARGQEKEIKVFDQRSAADLPARAKKYLVPLASAGDRPEPGVFEVVLRVSMRVHELDSDAAGLRKDRIRTRSYNDALCGPVVRVRPGEQLRVHLRNDIARSEWDRESNPADPTSPHGFNVTNLHTHGLNVSPKGRSDNVFLEIGPEESVHLCFDVPPDHPCGTFWYHAHKHGSVAQQLSGGMAGVLIVEDKTGTKGSLDEDPAVAAATRKEHERVLVFQQIPYRPDPKGGVVEVRWEDVYATPEQKAALEQAKVLARPTLVNGEKYPTIRMYPGEVQRWRCVHAGLEDSLELLLVKADAAGSPLDYTQVANRVPLNEIAVDGLPLGTLEAWKATALQLQPGYRSDLLVQVPSPGVYVLMSQRIPAERSVTGIEQKEIYLARVEVAGVSPGPAMALPKPEDLKPYPAKQGLAPILNVAAKRSLDFRSNDSTKKYLVDQRPFDPDDVHFRANLGDAEEWTLNPAAGFHPFHVHVNPFAAVRLNAKGDQVPVWRDTLFISEWDGPVSIRTRFKKFAGKTVVHCHNLRHEDQGMMAAWEILGADLVPPTCAAETPGLAAGRAAPDWKLLDGKSAARTRSDYAGKKLLLVFSRGSGCVHCRAQIEALVGQAEQLTKAGLAVVVVVPVPPAKLPGTDFPFAALSDEDRVAFADYGLFPGRALHGTYLIDAKGVVRWANAGDAPFMDVGMLPAKARELLK